jgi:outer membrane protein TolC
MIRSNVKARSFALVVVSAALSGVFAMPDTVQNTQDSLTIKDALRLVLARNPSLAQAEASLVAARERTASLKSAYYPSVSGIASDVDMGPISEISLGAGPALSLYPANNYDIHVGLDYTLWDFGKRALSLDAGKNQEAVAGDRLHGAKIALSYQVMQIFNTILLLQKGVLVNDEQIATLNSHLQFVKVKTRTGSATEFDTLTTAVQRASAENQRITLTNNLSKELTALRILLGLPLGAPLFLKGDFPVEPVALNSDSLIADAFQNRPEHRLSLHAQVASRIQVQSAKQEYYPVITGFATAGIKNGYIQKMPPDLNEPVPNWTVGGRLTVPIFDGYRRKHAIAEAQANERAAASGLFDIEERIRTEVLQAKADVEAALAQIAVSSLKVRQAARSFELARIRFETGTITNTDVLDEQNKYVEAEYAHVQNQYQYVISLLALDRTTGRMADQK